MTVPIDHLFQLAPAFAIPALAFSRAAFVGSIQPEARPAQPVHQVRPNVAWTRMFTVDASRLSKLACGWDGPGSVPVAAETLSRAHVLLSRSLGGRADAAPPFLVPCGDGSLQIEWHELHGELELAIDADGSISIWGRNYNDGHEFEGCGEEALVLFYGWAPWIAASGRHESDVPTSQAGAFFQIAA